VRSSEDGDGNMHGIGAESRAVVEVIDRRESAAPPIDDGGYFLIKP
jgi:hypothetical protein